MHATTKFLLEDFSAVDGVDVKHPTQAIVDASQVVQAIGSAHNNNHPIRVYALGPCILDWTKNVPRGTPKIAPVTESDG